MAIITQTGTTITADFSQIENQYQNNTFSIEVNLTDTTFKDYIVMLSIQNPQYKAEAFTIPVIGGVAKLPYYCTSFLGTTTISLFGYKVNSDEIITTNKIDIEVVASNPTNIHLEPADDDWFNTMKAYTDGMIDALGKTIVPSIGEDGYWYIGGIKTEVKADGSGEASVPVGGKARQVLTKRSDTDYDSYWSNLGVTTEVTLTTSWSNNTQSVNLSYITTADSPILDVKMTGEVADMEKIQEEWSKILKAETGNGTITFTCKEPTTIPLTVLVKGI